MSILTASPVYWIIIGLDVEPLNNERSCDHLIYDTAALWD